MRQDLRRGAGYVPTRWSHQGLRGVSPPRHGDELPRLGNLATFPRSQRNGSSLFARVCFNTGAGGRWEEKRWKSRHYRDLAVLIRARAPQAAIVLVGGPSQAELNAALLASGVGFIDGGTSNSIDLFSALVAASDIILTPDSLGYHVACAVSTPAVCLVGPTSPWELDLYGTNQVLYADLPCIACYRARCPYDRTCMDALMPEAVSAHTSFVADARVHPGVVAICDDAGPPSPLEDAAA